MNTTPENTDFNWRDYVVAQHYGKPVEGQPWPNLSATEKAMDRLAQTPEGQKFMQEMVTANNGLPVVISVHADSRTYTMHDSTPRAFIMLGSDVLSHQYTTQETGQQYPSTLLHQIIHEGTHIIHNKAILERLKAAEEELTPAEAAAYKLLLDAERGAHSGSVIHPKVQEAMQVIQRNVEEQIVELANPMLKAAGLPQQKSYTEFTPRTTHQGVLFISAEDVNTAQPGPQEKQFPDVKPVIDKSNGFVVPDIIRKGMQHLRRANPAEEPDYNSITLSASIKNLDTTLERVV